LTMQQNHFKIELKKFEDDLLSHLSAAHGSFLSDNSLVEQLENTKCMATHIQCKGFYSVFNKAMEHAEWDEDVQTRVRTLTEAITYSVFLYTSQGLLERDKLTFLSNTAFQILLSQGLIDPQEFEFLLHFPVEATNVSAVSFLSPQTWGGIKNVHLVARWLPSLDDLLETAAVDCHASYRVFITAEPVQNPEQHVIPRGILENAIKITNEPPSGMNPSLHDALNNFSQDTLDMCCRGQEFNSMLFSLCFFHACVTERRKFGPQGWNHNYPFSTADLTISAHVLYNYLEANSKFGAELFLCPGFLAPPFLDYTGYHVYIDENLPTENPMVYGLHLNADLRCLTVTSENLFRSLCDLQPQDPSRRDEATESTEEKVRRNKVTSSDESRREYADVNTWPLDKMTLTVDVTKKVKEDFGHPPREGAYIHGLFMEGARWDVESGIISEAFLRDLTPSMPVLYVRALPAEEQEVRNTYECPVYRTKQRGSTYVWSFHLRTKEPPAKWVVAGVALLLSL
ncbi:hypothetical protein GOODEAATRI_014061, partial [Goodea atripinnis]